MRLLIKDRGQGKTTQLIYTSEATGYPIVVETPMQKSALMNKAKDMNVIIPEPMTIHDIKQNMKLRSSHIKKVVIDEGYNIIEKALNEYIGCNVMAVTLTDRIKEKTQLQNKVQELLTENKQLKESLKHQTVINEVKYNVRGSSRHLKTDDIILPSCNVCQIYTTFTSNKQSSWQISALMRIFKGGQTNVCQRIY